MRRKLAILSATCAALFALGGVSAGNAFAVTLHEGEAGGPVIPAGTPITGFSENLTFNAGLAILECDESELNGQAGENPAEPGEGPIEGGRFEGTGGNPECPTSLEGVTVVVTAIGLPWTLSFNGAGETLVTGNPVGFEGEIRLNGEPVTTCTYETNAVENEFELGVPLEPPTGDKVVEQPFNLGEETPALGLCGEEGKLNGEFALTVGEDPGGPPIVVTNP